jgi:hypothetical protein
VLGAVLGEAAADVLGDGAAVVVEADGAAVVVAPVGPTGATVVDVPPAGAVVGGALGLKPQTLLV